MRLPRRLLSGLLIGLVCLISNAPAVAQQGGFQVISSRMHLAGNVYQLDSDLRLDLGDTALEALQKGVPLTLELGVEILRERPGLWDELVADIQQRYILTFHHLTQRYLVIDLNGERPEAFAAHSAAIASLSRIRNLPILERKLLLTHNIYRARVRVRLDIESLPAPLRLWAYLSPGWDLASEWFEWRLPSLSD